MSQITSVSWILLFCLLLQLTCRINGEPDEKAFEPGEKKLSESIMKILEHYKQDNPVGLPGLDVPDPMDIPDMKRGFGVATMNFKKMKVYGLKNFKIINVKSELSSMAAHAALRLDMIQVMGNYTMATWLSRSQGPFFVNLTNVNVKGFANLAVERDGKVRAQDIKMDITFGSLSMNFENLGFMLSAFQGMLNSVGSYLFDSIKPFVLKEAYTHMRVEINKALDNVVGDIEFPNSISPFDKVIADARNKVRSMGFDPLKIKDYNSTEGLVHAQLFNTWITGISSFYRVNNITLAMENNTLIADVEIGTQRLLGTADWSVMFLAGLLSKEGTASFSVEYINARIVVGQPLDTRKHPELRDLQLDVGNIQVRCDGAGTADYLVEIVVNILPNLLRYQIMDALEGPIQSQVQNMFNQIQVENVIKSKLPEVEALGEKGFKLSDWQQVPEETPKDEDEFWNF